MGFSRVKGLKERTDVWRREGLNVNALQQSQVSVLERQESGMVKVNKPKKEATLTQNQGGGREGQWQV